MKMKRLLGSVLKMNNKNIWISLLLVLCIFIVLSMGSFPFYEGAVDMKSAKEQAEKEKASTKQSSTTLKETNQKKADMDKSKIASDKDTRNKAAKGKIDNTISEGREKIRKTQEYINAKKKILEKAKVRTRTRTR